MQERRQDHVFLSTRVYASFKFGLLFTCYRQKSDPFAAVVRVLTEAEYRDDVLLDKHDQECYAAYNFGFLHVIYIGIDRIQDGVHYGEKAVKAAFSKN